MARLLVDHGDDDRVFKRYLHAYAETHPYSGRVLRKRRKDLRIAPALKAPLAVEERECTWGGKEEYVSDEFGLIAQLLASLGESEGDDALARFRKYKQRCARRVE